MLMNPFTPSEIAAQPEDFFGRSHELRTMERSVMQGSVAIQGAIGIGKSSLLSRCRLLMEGFDSDYRCITAISTGHKDITNVDEAARLLLESFADVDERTNKIKFNVGKLLEIESSEVCRYFATGRHLAGLTRFMEKKNIEMLLDDHEYLILAVDEADKCPVPLAQLIRALTTQIQQAGVKRVRFMTAGVSPYFQFMIDEDPGVSRFFYKVMTLTPMDAGEATELVTSKFHQLISSVQPEEDRLSIDPTVIQRIVALSGGHPHILQLMGSHVVENEIQDPDGVIDSRDLVNSLRAICYEDRAHVYESTLHYLDIHGRLDVLRDLLDIGSAKFPTRIDRHAALGVAEKDALQWFVHNNVLTVLPDDDYGLMDEFLRIRMLLDAEEAEVAELERRMIERGTARETPYDELEFDERFHEDWDTFSHPYDREEDTSSEDW